MRRPINLARLTPLRRGLVLGFLRGKRHSRKELRQMALDYDTELLALREEFDQLACAHACLVTLCEVRRLATFETALI